MGKLLNSILFALALVAAQPAFAAGSLTACKIYGEDYTFAMKGTGWRDARVLAANTAETYTFTNQGSSAQAHYVFFSSSCSAFYVQDKASTAATVPAADVTNGESTDLNPTQRWYPAAITAISLIAPTDCVVTMNVCVY